MIKVRTATIDDIDVIMQIEKSSFVPLIQEEKSVFLERINACPQLFLIFYDDNENNDNEEIVGYLSAELLSDIPCDACQIKLGHSPVAMKSLFINNDCNKAKSKAFYIYISSFAIFPQKKGKGTGKMCWNCAVDYFETVRFSDFNIKIKGFLLLVNELWEAALSIYKKSGFSEINIFENFFKNEEKSYSNGILMQKVINRVETE